MTGIGGAIATVLAWVASIAGLELSEPVAVALATLLIFAVSYLTPER